MKRLLVIAYYFPPMGLSGVQRIARFVKYLPEYGWTPTVLTVEPAGYFAFDQTLLDELHLPEISIVRTPSFDPTRLFKRKTSVSLPGEASRALLAKLSQFFFVPDNKIGWYAPAVRRAIALQRETPFDCIFATAPPYTCGLIAQHVSTRCNVPFVVDFRDDWLGNPRHIYPTSLHRWLHNSLENRVFESASSITTINEVIARALMDRHPARASKVKIIRQGYDPADFDINHVPVSRGRFRVLYTGVFYDVQTPDYFLRALARFLEEQPEARSNLDAGFVGLVPGSSRRLIEELGLQDTVTLHGYLPHDRVIEQLKAADVLWMTIGSGPGQESISTGKLYEYFGANKPVLGLVPEGAAREELKAYGASFLAHPEDVGQILSRIREIYERWQEGTLPAPAPEFVASFDRKKLTGVLANVLNGAT